jgi:hypothetical protein
VGTSPLCLRATPDPLSTFSVIMRYVRPDNQFYYEIRLSKWHTTTTERRHFPECFILPSSTLMSPGASAYVTSCMCLQEGWSLNVPLCLQGSIFCPPAPSFFPRMDTMIRMYKVTALEAKKDHPYPHNVNSNFQLSKFSEGWRWEWNKMRRLPGYLLSAEMESSHFCGNDLELLDLHFCHN